MGENFTYYFIFFFVWSFFNCVKFSPKSSKNVDLCREGEQQDSVELLQVLLDGLHEDLNRIKQKIENQDIPDSAGREDKIVSQEHWNLYKRQNNSLIVDLFNLQVS